MNTPKPETSPKPEVRNGRFGDAQRFVSMSGVKP